MPSYNRPRRVIAVSAIIVFMAACGKDKTPPTPTGPVTQKEINNWVLDSMRFFYLWSNQLPGKADEQTETLGFFNKLKNPADRFSLMYNPDDPATFPKSMLYTYGFDFTVISMPQSPAGVIGVITFVMPGSQAALQGLQRGSYFTRINGAILTGSNAATLSATLLAQSAGVLTPATVTGGNVTEGNPVTLPAESAGTYPIYGQSIRNINGRRVGYLYYNYFNDQYNTSLLEVFRQFKTAGVNELILDLRYNPGGSVTAAAVLTALIAPGVSEQNIFTRYSGNARMGQRSITFQSALSVPESGAPIAFSTLSPGRLSLSRVFILAGPQTASAAELTINNLRPFTEVVLIGQTTFGKDKGAVIITDGRTPRRISWTLMPITYNLSNAKGEGGYTQGITPLYQVNEMSQLPLLPIGDNADPLIAKAISILSGNGRQTAPIPDVPARIYFDSRHQQAAITVVSIPSSFVR